MEFYYYDGDERKGPYRADELVEFAQMGILTPTTVIEAGGKRAQASKVKGLFPEEPSEIPPASEPPVVQNVPDPFPIDEILSSPSQDTTFEPPETTKPVFDPQKSNDSPAIQYAIANFYRWCRFVELWGIALVFLGYLILLLSIIALVITVVYDAPFVFILMAWGGIVVAISFFVIPSRVIRFFGVAGFYWLAKNGDLDERTKLKRR